MIHSYILVSLDYSCAFLLIDEPETESLTSLLLYLEKVFKDITVFCYFAGGGNDANLRQICDQ